MLAYPYDDAWTIVSGVALALASLYALGRKVACGAA